MTATAAAHGPRINVTLTAARVTRIAKQIAPELRWSSEKGVRGILVRVWDAPAGTEVRLLNEARSLINARTNLTASVQALRSRGGRVQFRILVTDEAQEAADMQEQADKRTAALAVVTLDGQDAEVTVTATPAEPLSAEELLEDFDALMTAHGAPAQPAEELSYRGIRAGAYEVLRGGEVIGRVVRGPAAMSGATWAAYRPGGGQVTAGSPSREQAGLALATQPARQRDASPRIAVDADCPGCGYPERSYDPASGMFGCSSLRQGGRCGYESAERNR